jgi:hypothetical protein
MLPVLLGCGERDRIPAGLAPPAGPPVEPPRAQGRGALRGGVVHADSTHLSIAGVPARFTSGGLEETVTSAADGALLLAGAAVGEWRVEVLVPSGYRLGFGETGTRVGVVAADQTTRLSPFRLNPE